MARPPYVKRSLRDFWQSLSLPLKASLIIFLAITLFWAASLFRTFTGTTEDRLNTVIVYRGRMILMHREAAGANYVTASGPDSGFVLFYTGAFKTPTTKGTLW